MMPDREIHVIDDDPAMRDSLLFLLESAGMKVRVHESAVAFINVYRTQAVSCIVTDVRMPEMSGLDLVRRLKSDGASHPIIVITGHADVPLAVEAMKAGVSDFIEKPFDDEVLLSAIRTALKRSEQSDHETQERTETQAKLASLSAREKEVLDHLVSGRPNKVIAHEMGISPRTVEVYRANVMSKMQARSLSELVRATLTISR